MWWNASVMPPVYSISVNRVCCVIADWVCVFCRVVGVLREILLSPASITQWPFACCFSMCVCNSCHSFLPLGSCSGPGRPYVPITWSMPDGV